MIALATCKKFPGLLNEEAQLPSLFAGRGLEARPVVWNDPAADWSRCDAVVLRAIWDYFEHVPEFLRWLSTLEERGVRLVNSFPLVRWNHDKIYLRELEQKGVAILPTAFFERGQRPDLAAIVAERDWNEIVLKPSVSGGGWRTHRIPAGQAARFQPQLEEILRDSGALVQPFVPEVVSEGETSQFFFGGAFSHAVIKKPAAGEFRAQPLLGGSFARLDPGPQAIEESRRLLDLLPARATYARIDGVRIGGRFHLMEVEAIEPYLFTTGRPDALDRYVGAVLAALA